MHSDNRTHSHSPLPCSTWTYSALEAAKRGSCRKSRFSVEPSGMRMRLGCSNPTPFRLVVILVSVVIATAGFLATGSADPYADTPFASAASVAANYVQDAEGKEASTFLSATKTTDSTTLFIRICDWPVQLCTEYLQEIPEGDYQLDAFNNRGRLRTSVEGLGFVNVTVYSFADNGPEITCPDLIATRSSSTFIGEMAADSFGAYGGQIGPWFLIGGHCGINGRNVRVVTASA